MPVKPQAQRITCRQCGWATLYAPASDALIEQPPSTCQQCGSKELSYTPAKVIKNILSSMLSRLKRVMDNDAL